MTAAIDIRAPADIIWALMTDCAASVGLADTLKSCRVLKARPAERYDIREHVVDYSFLFPKVRNIFKSHYASLNEIYFYRVGGDLEMQEGVWRLGPGSAPGTTRVTHKARVALGGPVPGFLARRGARKDAPDLFIVLKERAEALAAARDITDGAGAMDEAPPS